MTLTPSVEPGAVEKNRLYAQQDSADGPVVAAVVALVEPRNDGLNAKAPYVSVQVFDSSGSVTKKFELPEDRYPASAGIYGTTLVLGTNAESARTAFTAYSIKSGKQLWSLPATYNANCQPVPLLKGRLAACFDNEIRALDAQTGATIWSREQEGPGQIYSLAGARAVAVSWSPPGSGIMETTVLKADTGKDLAVKTASTVGDPKTGMVAATYSEYIEPAVAMRVFTPTGETAYELTRAAEKKIGEVHPLGMYDGRLWLKANQGIVIVNAATGANDPLTQDFGEKVGPETSVRVPIDGTEGITILTTMWSCLSGNGVCDGTTMGGSSQSVGVVHTSGQPSLEQLLDVAGPLGQGVASATAMPSATTSP